jgi:hypothetical protein
MGFCGRGVLTRHGSVPHGRELFASMRYHGLLCALTACVARPPYFTSESSRDRLVIRGSYTLDKEQHA